MQCPKCGNAMDVTDDFCGQCGARNLSNISTTIAALPCSRCGATLRVGAKFCGQCGLDLASTVVNHTVLSPTVQAVGGNTPTVLPTDPQAKIPTLPATNLPQTTRLGTSIWSRENVWPVGAVAWSPDGKRIAFGSTEGTVHIWDAASGSNLF